MSAPTFEDIQAELSQRLAAYVGRTTLTPDLLESIQQQTIAMFRDLCPGSKPIVQLTAGQARGLGVPVPDNIPDCAVADVEFGTPTVDITKPDTVRLTMIPKTSWQWVEVNLVVDPTTKDSQKADHQ